MRTWVRRSTYSYSYVIDMYVQTMHVSLPLLYCSSSISVDSIGPKTGTHWDEVKSTRWPHITLPGLCHPDPTHTGDRSRTWAIQTGPAHTCRSKLLAAGKFTRGSLSLRKGLVNGYNMLLNTINSVMARGVRFLLGFTVHQLMRKTGPGIPVFGYCPKINNTRSTCTSSMWYYTYTFTRSVGMRSVTDALKWKNSY